MSAPGLFDLEAEQAVLGALMLSPSMAAHVSGLTASHFYDPVHQRIYGEIMPRLAAGGVADGVTLRAWAEQDSGLAEIGGRRYLMKLMERACAISAEVRAYAELIVWHSERRQSLAAIERARLCIEKGEGEPFAAVQELDALLRDLSGAESAAATMQASGATLLGGLDTPLLSTRLHALDKRLGGFARGDLIILAGRPSMGKSAVAAQIARNVAFRGGGVHFASLEMSKEQLAARAISAESRRGEYSSHYVQYFAIRAGRQIDREQIAALAARLPESLVVDDRAAQTLAQLEASARATRRRCGRLDLIVVDYLQLMRAGRSDGRVHEVTEISQGLKAIAKRLNCPLLALAQLNRSVENRECKRPTLSDLRDSGAIEQDADAVLAVYREAYYQERAEPGPDDDAAAWSKWKSRLEAIRDTLEIITLKNRSGPIGADSFTAYLQFDTIRDRDAA